MADANAEERGLRSRHWLLSYRTSSTLIDGRPVNMLHDFYIPALSLAKSYDRVAGFFRSSSLAAASQGFSALVGRGGKVRMIVGADLDPEDVRAILRGDADRLEKALDNALGCPEQWPESVQDGVALLGWMVRSGHLQIKVAFRVHGKTGEPIPFDSIEDGYVHEKWLLLADEFGNRIFGSGTLNESRTALVLNAENLDVHCDWRGGTEQLRVEDAVEAFEKWWADKVAHLRVMSLPEAVSRRLIQVADQARGPVEIDGTSAAPRQVNPPSAIELLRFAVLRDAPRMPGGRFVGMETAPVTPWPHQAVVARRLVETWPYSYLLCDEVGLGKTIEAGLAFRSLYLSGLAKRILVTAPAGLIRQWHAEMASKMLMRFGLARTAPVRHEYLLPEQQTSASNSLFEPDLVIVSTGLLVRREWAEHLKASQRFDIALVDEAHALRRRNSTQGLAAYPDYGNLFEHVRDFVRASASGLWLATATPMQINPVEVYDLLSLTQRAGQFQHDPSLAQAYYDVVGNLVSNEELADAEWQFLRRAVKAVAEQDPLYWRYLKASVFATHRRLPDIASEWLDYGRTPKGGDREIALRLLRSASPLSRVMFRHTRPLLEIYRDSGELKGNLPHRHILPVPRIVFTDQERHVYDQLGHYLSELRQQIHRNGSAAQAQQVRFLRSFFHLRFASSLFAIRETLRRRLERVRVTLQHLPEEGDGMEEFETRDLQQVIADAEDETGRGVEGELLKNRTPEDLKWEEGQIVKLLHDLEDLSGPSSKMQALLNCLDQRLDHGSRRIKQTVVFTRFYDTLCDLLARLKHAKPDILVATYSGQGASYFDATTRRMIQSDREEIKKRFLRGEIDVLLCTDAAAEGLNLQTADLVVNFDLGWNPMKVEQRIGRIDRIGQKHDNVYVLNLCYAGSEEQVVYERLLNRLAQANLIVGTQQVSLLPVDIEDFEKLAHGEITPEQLEQEALERLRQQRERNQSMDVPAEHLYAAYRQLGQEWRKTPKPVDLDGIWNTLISSSYLRDLGCEMLSVGGESVLRVSGIEAVPEHALLTGSRHFYERGSSEVEGRIHFASYGDPYFDAILSHFEPFGLPKCVRRLSVPVPRVAGAEVVGYAVAAVGASGLQVTKLITRLEELENLWLAEDQVLTDEQVEPLKEELRRICQEEYGHYAASSRIERQNMSAGAAHILLVYSVARSLLEARAQYAEDQAMFLPTLTEVFSLFADRQHIRLSDLPATLFRERTGDLLFDVEVPRVGETAHISVPRILGTCATDAVQRLANGLKLRRSEVSVKMVLERLDREVREWHSRAS